MLKMLKKLLCWHKDYSKTYKRGLMITTKCKCGKVLKEEFKKDA